MSKKGDSNTCCFVIFCFIFMSELVIYHIDFLLLEHRYTVHCRSQSERGYNTVQFGSRLTCTFIHFKINVYCIYM